MEGFLKGVEARAAALQDSERNQVQERLKLAREFLGSHDPLDFFLSWKTPSERYSPGYGSGLDDSGSEPSV